MQTEINMIPTTCGLFLLTEQSKELLITHPTNQPMNKWSIPKGILHIGESEIDCAYRELEEETTITKKDVVYNLIEILSLGTVLYKSNKKRISGFLAIVKDDLKLHILKCNSLIDNTNLPENDITKWEDIETAKQHLHEAQIRLLDLYKGK